MFDQIKIRKKCNSFLKKYNMRLSEELHIFKQNGFIHCQIDDWRGPAEVDSFPMVSIDNVIFKLIEMTVLEYVIKSELKKRTELKSKYKEEYGNYDPRKYYFEESLSILKDFEENYFKKQIREYTKYINKNRSSKFKWKYNIELKVFELKNKRKRVL